VPQCLIEPDGDEARHVRFMPDYRFTHGTKDVDWIAKLGSEPAAQWIVITGDKRIRKNLAERAAWIKAFVLAPVYQNTPINQGASVLLWRWPQMKAFIEQAAPGSMFELSINRRTGFVPLAVK
jgi:hypothetical protein